MEIYKENPDKLNFTLNDSENDVTISLDCFHGTVGSVSFFYKGLKNIVCGKTIVIDTASELKGKTIPFKGKANNPDGNTIQLKHTIRQGEENILEYTFPDDYSGTPDYDETNENPNYEFSVNFV